MHYLIIGAGGTGGILGWQFAKAGKEVTLIARGAHLMAIQERGLTVDRLWDHTRVSIPVRALSMEEYLKQMDDLGKPDVILVCVKDYSLESVYPFIAQVSDRRTIVIPILNVYGTGARMQDALPDLLVTDGCIYVSANISEPGVLLQHAPICRVVFGVRKPGEFRPELETIAKDMEDSGIQAVLSSHIQRDALQKFCYVSPVGAAGLLCDCTAGEFQREGSPRELLKAMMREIIRLADAMGIPLEPNLVETNLGILDGLPPETTTSMQRDILEGKPSEADGLVFSVIRMARQYQVEVPEYEKCAKMLKEKQA